MATFRVQMSSLGALVLLTLGVAGTASAQGGAKAGFAAELKRRDSLVNKITTIRSQLPDLKLKNPLIRDNPPDMKLAQFLDEIERGRNLASERVKGGQGT